MEHRRTLTTMLKGWKVAGFVALLTTTAFSADLKIPSDQADRLKILPYGITDQASMLIRDKHIESVRFYGGGGPSRYGYVRRDGIMPMALWLDLKNRWSAATWANAIIDFSKPINASHFNSLVLWVRVKDKGKRFWLSLQDNTWTQAEAVQSRTDALPANGFPTGEPIQVVVPFSSIYSDKPIDLKNIVRLGIEFGEDTAGNSKKGAIEILGIALVAQKTRVAGIKLVTMDALAKQEPAPQKPRKKVARKAPARKPAAPAKEAVKTPETPVVAAQATSIDLTPAIATGTAETAEPMPAAAVSLAETEIISEAEMPESDEEFMGEDVPEPPFSRFRVANAGWLAGVVVLLVGLAWMVFRGARGKAGSGLGKIFLQIQWPRLKWDPQLVVIEYRKFWKGLAASGVKVGSLSPYQSLEKEQGQDEYFGEAFLRKQIRFALQAGIEVFPSLCFARTVFHYETFLANPKLFWTKNVAQSDRHLSDEELRVKHIGHFPVWIPPYWQRQHGLPQRLMVAYGKLPGVMASNDSVQYNLVSRELRAFAVRVIERFAGITGGIRIEGATALLNSSLNRYWLGYLPKPLKPGADEFWDEVITEVKAKHPNFIFVADNAGLEAKEIRSLGFDYFENDHLREILVNQIRLEAVGKLPSILSAEPIDNLHRSIFNIAPLLQTENAVTLTRQQNVLSCVLLALMPGIIQHDGVKPGLNEFFKLAQKMPALRSGDFVLLSTSDPAVFAFARWEGRNAFVVVANFAMSKRDATVRFDPLVGGLDDRKMYLFSDTMHGAPYLKDLPAESASEPAVAVLGQDLRENGLSVSLPALSLRLFNVNLSRVVSRAQPEKIRQFHKT